MRPGGRVRVSTNGGSQPRWRADGKELFYLRLDGAMMSVDTERSGEPRCSAQAVRLAVLGQPRRGSIRRDGRWAAVPLDCSRGPASHAIDRPYQLAVRLGGTIAAVRTSAAAEPTRYSEPAHCPRASCAPPSATSYFLRPAFWPALLRPPACFSARLAAQYARIRSPTAFRASADMPVALGGTFRSSRRLSCSVGRGRLSSRLLRPSLGPVGASFACRRPCAPQRTCRGVYESG